MCIVASFTTQNHPSYWLRAGNAATIPSGSKCPAGQTAYNTLDTHPHPFTKTVTIGCFGMYNCMEWNFSADLGSGNGQPTDYDYAQLEGPTVSIMYRFVLLLNCTRILNS